MEYETIKICIQCTRLLYIPIKYVKLKVAHVRQPLFLSTRFQAPYALPRYREILPLYYSCSYYLINGKIAKYAIITHVHKIL
jgi:hypothetical protein